MTVAKFIRIAIFSFGTISFNFIKTQPAASNNENVSKVELNALPTIDKR